MADPAEDEVFQGKSDRFINWLSSSGARISSKIELTDLRDRSAGRGVVTREDIGEDEELFTIPQSAILDISTCSLPDGLRNKVQDPWLSLILAMVREYRLGGESRYKPYFDVLPATLDTLMYWTNQELEHLRGSAVVDKIGKESADIVFTEEVLPIIRQNSEVFGAGSISDDELIALCHRMGSLIMAYAFDLEGSTTIKDSNEEWEEDSDSGAVLAKGMVPLADMLNADADRNNAKLFYEDDGTISMRTIKPVKKEEELFNDYGSLPRADVLRRYGYVTDLYAQYDVVEISNDLIKQVAKEEYGISEEDFDSRLRYLSEHGLEEDSWDVARAQNEEGQFSEEFRVFINTVVTSDADLDRLNKQDKLPKPKLSDQAMQLLHAVLVQRESMYPSQQPNTAEANGSTGSNGVHANDRAERRLKMAQAVVEGEKQVLQEALVTTQALLQSNNKRKADTARTKAETQQETRKKQRR